MKSRTLSFTAIAIFTLFAMPVRLATQEQQGHNHHKHQRYILHDVGTFGGPGSVFFESQRLFTKSGILVGGAETKTSDPYAPNCFNPDCLIEHGFEWRNGVLTVQIGNPG